MSVTGVCADMPEDERNAVAQLARACIKTRKFYVEAYAGDSRPRARPSRFLSNLFILEGLTNALITGLNDKALADELGWDIKPLAISERELREVCVLSVTLARIRIYHNRVSGYHRLLENAQSTEFRQIIESYAHELCDDRDDPREIAKRLFTHVMEEETCEVLVSMAMIRDSVFDVFDMEFDEQILDLDSLFRDLGMTLTDVEDEEDDIDVGVYGNRVQRISALMGSSQI